MEGVLKQLQMLEIKLLDYGLIPVEVGGKGNCLFHVISHQLFNDPIHHFLHKSCRS